MLKFMVLSAPRSASTWMANWLSTERTLCLHDPVLEHTPEALDSISCDRMLGIACTGLPLLPDWVNAHPSRKVIVHRDLKDVNRSLVSIGLTELGAAWDGLLDRLEGFHVDYEKLFDPVIASAVYQHLTQLPFDAPRHRQLRDMHVEPQFERIAIVPERARDFRARVGRAFA